jgi:hypothetical protein
MPDSYHGLPVGRGGDTARPDSCRALEQMQKFSELAAVRSAESDGLTDMIRQSE